jgi:nicotinate-nucleotide adenylyltransferase
MVVQALQDERYLLASGMELLRTGPSYTIETLRRLKQDQPENEYCFIGGSDSLKELHLWKDCGKLLREHCLVFVQRPGAEVSMNSLSIAPELGRRAITISH